MGLYSKAVEAEGKKKTDGKQKGPNQKQKDKT